MRDKRSRTLVVSFRGTHERQVKTLTNLAFVPVPPVLSSTITQVRQIRKVSAAHARSQCLEKLLSSCRCRLSRWRCGRDDGADVHRACTSG